MDIIGTLALSSDANTSALADAIIMDAVERCDAEDVGHVLVRAFGMPATMTTGDIILNFWLLRHVPSVARGIDKMMECPEFFTIIRHLFMQELDKWYDMHWQYASWMTLVIDDSEYRRASLVDDVYDLNLISPELRNFIKNFANIDLILI